MRHGPFLAQIKVGPGKVKEPATEYNLQIEGSTATAYIEAQAGQAFEIAWETSSLADGDIDGRIYLDGSDTSITAAQFYEGKLQRSRSGVLVGSRQSRPFRFAAISTTDATEDGNFSLHSISASEHLGTITLKLYRGQRGKETRNFVPRNTSCALADSLQNEVQVKKSKVSFVTTLGETVASKRSKTVSFKRSDRAASPFFVFRFIYRSRAILQALGHMPHDSPPPQQAQPVASGSGSRAKPEVIEISSDDDDDAVDTQEVRDLKEQLRIAQQKAKEEARAKRSSTAAALNDDDEDIKPDIKPKLKMPKIEGGAIDLTSD